MSNKTKTKEQVGEAAEDLTNKAAKAAENGEDGTIAATVMKTVTTLLNKLGNASEKVWEKTLDALNWLRGQWNDSKTVQWAKNQLDKLKNKVETWMSKEKKTA